jgi:ABC-2 type transport system ATP-binding protein
LVLCLETSGLTYRFGAAEALAGVDLRVPQASIYGFLGPNGAGKTTTLRLVLGLLRLQQGSVSIFGRELQRERTAILRSVGSLIETPSAYDHLTAFENLKTLALIHGCSDRRIEEVLELVNLADAGRKRVRAFSLGMRQRLGIAAALLHRPALLVLDEPTNGLDPNGIIEVRNLLVELNRREGCTVLVSSHLLAEVDRLATHVGILNRGRLLFQGTMDQLRQQCQAVVSVHLSTSDDAAAAQILERAGVAARVVEGGLALPGLSDARVAALNRLLVEHHLDVYAIGAVRDDLETIFLNLVGSAA